MEFPLKNLIAEILIHIFICYPIFLNDVFNDMICLINTYSVLTLEYVYVEDIYIFSLLEGIIKESVKFL